MRHLRSLLRLGSFPQLMWGNLASHCNYVVTLYIGRSTLVGHRPMKSLLSVCPSVYSSVRPLLSFLKIGSLVFSDIIHDDSWPWYLLTDRARFLKKNFGDPNEWARWDKIGSKNRFFAIFSSLIHYFSLKLHSTIACNNV